MRPRRGFGSCSSCGWAYFFSDWVGRYVVIALPSIVPFEMILKKQFLLSSFEMFDRLFVASLLAIQGWCEVKAGACIALLFHLLE